MRPRTKAALSALLATAALAALVSAADARRIELSNQRIRAVWEANTPFVAVLEAIRVRCPVTIEGSFHSKTLSKVSGQLIGYITSAILKRPCFNGEAWIQNGTETLPNGTRPTSLPWHIRYDSFTGRLPEISRIQVQILYMGILGTTGFSACLYQTLEVAPAIFKLEIVGGVITGLIAEPFTEIPVSVVLGLSFCPEVKFEGGFASVTLQGSTTTKINVKLVQ
jgi:hypothetical protein